MAVLILASTGCKKDDGNPPSSNPSAATTSLIKTYRGTGQPAFYLDTTEFFYAADSTLDSMRVRKGGYILLSRMFSRTATHIYIAERELTGQVRYDTVWLDAAGRPVRERMRTGVGSGSSGGPGNETKFLYDGLGQLAATIRIDPQYSNTAPDTLLHRWAGGNMVATVALRSDTLSPYSVDSVVHTYDYSKPFARGCQEHVFALMRLGYNTRTSANMPTGQVTHTHGAGAFAVTRSYQYDAAGRVIKVTAGSGIGGAVVEYY